jgi:hypothetical protein
MRTVASRCVLLAAAALICWAVAPRPAAAQVRLVDPARNAALTIGGWAQTRYEYTTRDGAEDLSSFYLRRLRLDVRGHVYSERLTFRLMPEFARTASLRDGYINFAYTPALQIRFGQFGLPFQWHRYIGARGQHFAERGAPSETFGFPDGRDVGVMLHGVDAARTRDYAVGVFDGAGRNVQHSNSAGNMASARVTLALLGVLPRDETDYLRSAAPGLALGLGAQGATRSDVRAWDLGRSVAGTQRADWVTGTGDVSLRWLGLSIAGEAYLRNVVPADPDVASYTGDAYLVSTGLAIVPGLLEVVGRYAQLRLDRNDAATREREWGAGINIYDRGHDSKLRINYLDRHSHHPAIGGTTAFLIEYHLQF